MSLTDISTAVTSVVRRIFSKPPMAMPVDLKGKTAIVTGASPGSIGYETAKTLAGWGAKVIITTRSKTDQCVNQLQTDLQQSGAPHDVVGHPLDLTQADSVEQFVAWYKTNIGDELHILVNNAGVHSDIMGSWKQPKLSADGFEIHWRTNFLGPMHLTSRLLPLLQKAGKKLDPARVVFVASHLHQKGENSELFQHNKPYNSWLAYGQSKLGLVHGAFALQQRYATKNIQSYVLHPGSIATNIALKGMESNQRMKRLLEIANPLQAWFMLSPLQGAQTQIYCATSPGLPGGRYYDRCAVARPNPEASNSMVSNRLWEETQQWINSLPMAEAEVAPTESMSPA